MIKAVFLKIKKDEYMWYYLILAGLAGGLIGGMGMGGGTLLIPILTIFLSISQHLAQGLNLLVFIPTGIIALIIHAKNKLLDFKTFLFIIFPAIASAIGFSFLANSLDEHVLKIIFGIFLVIIGIIMLIIAIKNVIKSKNKLTDKLGV